VIAVCEASPLTEPAWLGLHRENRRGPKFQRQNLSSPRESETYCIGLGSDEIQSPLRCIVRRNSSGFPSNG